VKSADYIYVYGIESHEMESLHLLYKNFVAQSMCFAQFKEGIEHKKN
jgi:hypothetical protein